VAGRLIVRSGFWPRALGVPHDPRRAGLDDFLYAPLASRVFPVVLGIGLLGVAVTIFWLLVFGAERTALAERGSCEPACDPSPAEAEAPNEVSAFDLSS
jgi:hypothetical protein